MPDQDDIATRIARLDQRGLASLSDYLDFLLERHALSVADEPAPELASGPDNETVVGALKRLKSSYPMLDTDDLFHQASALMSEHLLQGRSAIEVIEELEELFARHYRKRVDNCQKSGSMKE